MILLVIKKFSTKVDTLLNMFEKIFIALFPF